MNTTKTQNCTPQISSQVTSHLVHDPARRRRAQQRNTVAINRWNSPSLRCKQTQRGHRHVTEVMVQRYETSLECERCHLGIASHRSHSETCRQCMTALACQDGQTAKKQHQSCRACRWLWKGNRTLRAHLQQLQTLRSIRQEKRTHEADDENAMVDHIEQKRAKTIGSLEVSALGDDSDERLDKA